MWIIKARWRVPLGSEMFARYLVLEPDREQAERLVTEKNPRAHIVSVQPVNQRIFLLP